MIIYNIPTLQLNIELKQFKSVQENKGIIFK